MLMYRHTVYINCANYLRGKILTEMRTLQSADKLPDVYFSLQNVNDFKILFMNDDIMLYEKR